MTTAVWASTFVEWMNPAAVITAAILPFFRASLRSWRGNSPAFHPGYIAHDVASGLTLPSFIALTLSGMSEDIAKHVTGHPLELAGAYGVIYTILGLFMSHD